jgi:hypothetical protein
MWCIKDHETAILLFVWYGYLSQLSRITLTIDKSEDSIQLRNKLKSGMTDPAQRLQIDMDKPMSW